MLDGVSKVFGDQIALDGVDLEVAAGEFLVIVGPSGSGKTTLLRLIAGLESPCAGRVMIGGRNLAGVLPWDRGVGLVFQSPALFPHLNVEENLTFGLAGKGDPRRASPAEVWEAVQVLGIGPLMSRYPSQLSGGERQRVALGRTLLRRPRVFLLDEPLSGLDAQLRSALREEIRRLHKRLGTATVYVTHDQAEALVLGDRIAVLLGGRIDQQGAPKEVCRCPRTAFVAGFLGCPAMNLVEGVLFFQDGGTWLRLKSMARAVRIRENIPPKNHKPVAVQAGILPGAFCRVPPGEGLFSGKVLLVEEGGGPGLVVHVRIPADPDPVMVKALLSPETCVELEGEISLDFKAEGIRLYDGSTGELLDTPDGA